MKSSEAIGLGVCYVNYLVDIITFLYTFPFAVIY